MKSMMKRQGRSEVKELFVDLCCVVLCSWADLSMGFLQLFLRWPDQALVHLDCVAYRLWGVCHVGCTCNAGQRVYNRKQTEKTFSKRTYSTAETLVYLLQFCSIWKLQKLVIMQKKLKKFVLFPAKISKNI